MFLGPSHPLKIQTSDNMHITQTLQPRLAAQAAAGHTTRVSQVRGDDDNGDDDGDDDDVLTLVHIPEILPVVTKQTVKQMHLDRRKQTSQYEIVRTSVSYQSVRETVLMSCM